MKQKTTKNKNKGAVALLQPKKPLSISTTQDVTLHSAKILTSTAGASGEWCLFLNDAYNPMGTHDARQGYWFDQLKTLYKRVFVGTVRYKVSVVSSGVGIANMPTCPTLTCVPTISSTAITTTQDEMVVRPKAKWTNIPSVQWNNSSGTGSFIPTSLSDSLKVRDFYQYKDWQDAEDLTTYIDDDSGLKTVYLHVTYPSITTSTFSVLIELWQDAHFFSPVVAAVS